MTRPLPDRPRRSDLPRPRASWAQLVTPDATRYGRCAAGHPVNGYGQCGIDAPLEPEPVDAEDVDAGPAR
jgi:hypothetical protein